MVAREVGTLWIGGELCWLEQVCLKSFVDKGQKITLFCYEDIPNVPEGVIVRDGREIIDTNDFIKYENKNSFALFADLFRLHMIHQCPGMIWIDTDVYCYRPMDYDSEYVMGFELPGEHRVNNAVLGLPSDSEMLQQMLDFTEDRHSIAPFLPKGKQKAFQKAADMGEPVHVSLQPWGVWGPLMVTHYTHALSLQDKVQPLDAFYPITFRERTKFLHRSSSVEKLLTENTTALHLWASNKRQIGNMHYGLPPKDSYLEKVTKDHKILAALAPVKGRAKTMFQTSLLDEVDRKEIENVADISGKAQGAVLMAYHKYNCDIMLVNLASDGTLSKKNEDWVDPYIDFLTMHEVPKDRIQVVKEKSDLKPVDLVFNLDGFGLAHKINGLKSLFNYILYPQSQMFMDIKKGSGAFPLLKKYGSNAPMDAFESGGKPVHRVKFHASESLISENDVSWDKIATMLAGDDGFYRPGPEGHSFVYTPRSKDTLVVTFDNLDITMTKRTDRRPWGFSFIEEQGWSMLGVLAGGWTWYRNQWVSDQFDELRDSGFFKQFKRVVFYGASMGGYAASVFCAAAPGSDVVAISPQSTLDKTIVPWETRYKVAWNRDYSDHYGDASIVSSAANRVYILYDPYEPLDSQHVARYQGNNVVKLRAPLLGHRLGSSLSQMGILTPIILGALNGTLSENDYYQMLRKRREFPRYQYELFNRTLKKGHTKLAHSLGEYVLARNVNKKIRKEMMKLMAG